MKSDDNTSWQYKPDGGAKSAPVASQGSSSAVQAPPTHSRTSTVSWTASEYIDHTRGAGWYVLLIIGTIVLAAGTYFLTKDYLATGAISVVGIIVAVFAARKPKQITYELTDSGLKIGQKFYEYNLFKSFAVIREGALSSVNLLPLKKFMPVLTAYFDPTDEKRIVDAMGAHLPFEEGKLDSIDRLTRRLRF